MDDPAADVAVRMKVTYSHKNPPYWEVTAADGRWWSVAYNQRTYTYLVTNRTGRILKEGGPTGRKVIDTVHNYERGTVS
jgi:hypothetical protein